MPCRNESLSVHLSFRCHRPVPDLPMLPTRLLPAAFAGAVLLTIGARAVGAQTYQPVLSPRTG